MKKILVSSFLSLFIILISACTGSNQAEGTNLEGNSWVLVSYSNNPPIEGTKVSLQFKDGQISGIAGCNHYGGSYKISGQTISFSDIFATEMFCADPQGIMDQEQTYLAALKAVERFDLAANVLTILTDSEQALIFEIEQISAAPSTELTSTMTSTPTPVDETPTLEPVISPPAGFKEYQDELTGISIYIPESWKVTGIVAGKYAIFLSYPEDKYIGGEALEAGDTKCDLNIQPPEINQADLIQQWKSDPLTTIISEEEITLNSGAPGTKMKIDSMGLSTALVTTVSERVVVLTCFGEMGPFDDIAASLQAIE